MWAWPDRICCIAVVPFCSPRFRSRTNQTQIALHLPSRVAVPPPTSWSHASDIVLTARCSGVLAACCTGCVGVVDMVVSCCEKEPVCSFVPIHHQKHIPDATRAHEPHTGLQHFTSGHAARESSMDLADDTCDYRTARFLPLKLRIVPCNLLSTKDRWQRQRRASAKKLLRRQVRVSLPPRT